MKKPGMSIRKADIQTDVGLNQQIRRKMYGVTSNKNFNPNRQVVSTNLQTDTYFMYDLYPHFHYLQISSKGPNLLIET
jgi:hypothetical protein